MTFFFKPTAIALTFSVALLMGGQAQAQSAQDMRLLTPQEHQAFMSRLQHANVSSQRAKITAEMNLLVRERSLKKRRAERAAGKVKHPNKKPQ